MRLGFFLSVTALGSIVSLCSAAQSRSFTPSEAEPVQIRVNANKRANYKIPRTIFGSFLEPIGNSTYNGLWVEILQNPSFEENLWSAPAVARMIQHEPSLARASELGLPLPWEPLNARQGNRYEPRWGDAANSWRSLAVLGVPGAETGIKQAVFLPVHRQLHYKGSIYVKHLSGPDGLDISIRQRNHSEKILSRAKLNASDLKWRKYSFALDVPTWKPQVTRTGRFRNRGGRRGKGSYRSGRPFALGRDGRIRSRNG